MRLFSKKVLILGVLLHVELFGDSLVHNFLTYDESFQKDSIASIYQESIFEKSYFEKVRVSIDHSHFSEIEREYAFRVYAKNPNEIKNEEKIYTIEKSMRLREEALKKERTMQQRYLLFSELFYRYGMLFLAEQKVEFLQKSLQKAKYLVEKESDITTLYRKKEALLDAKLWRVKQEQRYQRVLQEIERIFPLATKEKIEEEVALSLFLSPDRLVDFIAQESRSEHLVLTKEHPLLQNSSDKVALAASRLEALKIKEEFKLDNVEVKYDDSKKRKNALSIGVAVEIPLGEDSRRKVSEKIKLLKAKEGLFQNRQKLKQKMSTLQEEISEEIAYYKLVDREISENSFQTKGVKSYKLYETMQKQNFRLQKERLETLYQVLEKSVRLLYLSNRLKSTKLYTYFVRQK